MGEAKLELGKGGKRPSFWEMFILESPRGVLAFAATTPTRTTHLTACNPVKTRDLLKL